jgi:dihydropteroate synthase
MLVCGGKFLDLSRPQVMGVLNVTPDSFSDGGRYRVRDLAIAHGLRMIEQGAALIDVGGESTRPGASPVSVQEELDRVVPVIEGLAGTAAVISIDTSKPEVMRPAVAAGAGLINDVRALQMPGALDCAAALPAALCLMHMRGEPASMQQQPAYADVVTEVKAFLRQRAQACIAAGVAANRLLIDPGFGFGKTLEHNLALLRKLSEFAALAWPCLVGLSRKSMLGTITGRGIDERAAGSIALALIAVQRGASIVRAHDVAGTVDALRVFAAVENGV